MYIVFLSIIFVFAILMLASINKRLPLNLRKDGIIIIFYKIAAMLIDINLAGKVSLKSNDYKRLSLLYPAGNMKEICKEYSIKRLGITISLIFAGAVLSLLVTVSELKSNPMKAAYLIERNDYGGGNKDVELDVYADGEKVLEGEVISVEERRYTEDEIKEVFEAAEIELEKIVLGKNHDFENVVFDLTFPNHIDGYPISIAWEQSSYSVVDAEGKIHEENTVDCGSDITITAILSYYSYTQEHIFNVVVYPMPKDFKESFCDQIVKNIKDYAEATLSYEDLILPDDIEGRRITYKPIEKNDSWIILILFIFLSIIIYQAKDKDLNDEIQKRDNQMLMDYSKIVSKFSLLLGAGMTSSAAIKKIAAEYLKHREKTGMRYAYEEMLVAVREMDSGISENEAFISYGNRCKLQKYVKFAAMVAQNNKRGNAYLLENLEVEERDAFESRKSMARKLGEEAGTKLLLPMVMMLGIVMIIVIVPAFLSFSFS